MKYSYLFGAAAVFLAGWSLALLAVGLIAFGRDLRTLESRQQTSPGKRG